MQNFKNRDDEMAIYIVLGTGGAVAVVAVLMLLGACCRAKGWGRCMLYILCLILFLAIVVEVVAVAGVYKYSGTERGDSVWAFGMSCNDLTCECRPGVPAARISSSDTYKEFITNLEVVCCTPGNNNGTLNPTRECEWLQTFIVFDPVSSSYPYVAG